jgi:hypothetical protein
VIIICTIDFKERKSEMNESARDVQREYMRIWRSEHRDRIKLYQERYWQKKAEEAERRTIKESEHAMAE